MLSLLLALATTISTQAADNDLPYDRLANLYTQRGGAAADLYDFDPAELSTKMKCAVSHDTDRKRLHDFPVPRRVSSDGVTGKGPLFTDKVVLSLVLAWEQDAVSKESMELQLAESTVRRNMYDLVLRRAPQKSSVALPEVLSFRKVGKLISFKANDLQFVEGEARPVVTFGYCWRE